MTCRAPFRRQRQPLYTMTTAKCLCHVLPFAAGTMLTHPILLAVSWYSTQSTIQTFSGHCCDVNLRQRLRCCLSIIVLKLSQHRDCVGTFYHLDTVSFDILISDLSLSTITDRVMLLDVYRPRSRALTWTIHDEQSAAFQWLLSYKYPLTICSYFDIHANQS